MRFTLQNGIKMVSSIYGFSGFEPNTVLMGWSRNVQNADFLADILKDFNAKNLNAVFLDYDKTNGFGKKENIDIWWNGKGKAFKFFTEYPEISFVGFKPGAMPEVRILIINNDTSLNEGIIRNTNAISDGKTNAAQKLRVISDDFGSRSREELINSESLGADLLVLGLSQNKSVLTKEYIGSINRLSSFACQPSFAEPICGI